MNHEEIINLIDVDEKWDRGELGRDEGSVRAVKLTTEQQQAIDSSAGLQMISIRLPTSLIEDFKFLGDVHGLKYQTLMRQILMRWTETEKKHLATKAASAQIKAARKVASAQTELIAEQKPLNSVCG